MWKVSLKVVYSERTKKINQAEETRPRVSAEAGGKTQEDPKIPIQKASLQSFFVHSGHVDVEGSPGHVDR